MSSMKDAKRLTRGSKQRLYGRLAAAGALSLLLGAPAWLSTPATCRSEENAPMVAPGSVVRWPGQDLASCGLGKRSWQPLDGSCWYALDLLLPEGPLRLQRWTSAGKEELEVRIAPYPYEVQRITLEDDSKVNLSSSDLARVRRENARIGSLWSRGTARQFAADGAQWLHIVDLDGAKVGRPVNTETT